MWREVADYLSAESVVHPTGIDKVRLTAYRTFGPLSAMILQAMKALRPRERKLDKFR